MKNITWKSQELRNLCPPAIISEAEIYVKAIKNKIDRISFLVIQLNKSNGLIPVNFSSVTLRSSQLEVEIYIESLVTNLHSLADVLAQIVNVIVLKPLQEKSQYLKEKQIDIQKVKDRLSKITSIDSERGTYINEIIKEIESMTTLDAFLYIEGFANTIKHRNLIDTSLVIGNLIPPGYKVDAFEYKGKKILQTECSKICTNYKEDVIDKVLNIGNSINKYCQATFDMSV